MGHAVTQLVEALRYKPEGRGFDSRWCQSFRPHYGPGVDSTSNRNEYQTSLKTLHAERKGDGQTDRRRERSTEKRTDRRKDRYGEVDAFLQLLLHRRQTQGDLKNQIILGFGRTNPRHCAAVRGQITQLSVNRSLALSDRESRLELQVVLLLLLPPPVNEAWKALHTWTL